MPTQNRSTQMLRAGLCLLGPALLGIAPADAQPSPRPGSSHAQIYRPKQLHPQASSCSSPQLNYAGGLLISNLSVVAVYWNADVNSIAQVGLPGFFQGVTNSSYYDLLSEYSSSQDSIGQGSFVSAVTLTPSLCSKFQTHQPVCSLTDSQVQQQLNISVNSGVLPPKAPNRLYMVYFPYYVALTGPTGETGCQGANSGFCAYHVSDIASTVPYAAVMDLFDGACSTTCGDSTTAFDNLTALSSKVMAGVVTDPNGPNNGDATGWYDSGCGEVGDICAEDAPSAITVPGGSTYYVQPLWSNSLNTCVTTGLHPSFTLAGPSTATAGTPITVNLTVRNPAGLQQFDLAYVGTVHFTSTDSQATLPADFTFTSSKQGMASFPVTFATAAAQTVTATDTADSQITASLGVAVTGSQTITFTTNAPASAAYQSSFTVAATASSGLAPVFTSAGSCSNSGTLYTMTSGAGTCSVIANQPGNSSYSAAPTVTEFTTAQQIAPTVTFTGTPASETYGSKFTVAAQTNASTTAVITGSGACTASGTTVTMTSGTGNCSLTANWAADANYLAASASQTTAAVKAVPILFWGKLAPISYGTPLSGTQLDARANSTTGRPLAGTFNYAPGLGAILQAGKQTLTTTFTADASADYTTATTSVSLVVNKIASTCAMGTSPVHPTQGKPVQVQFVVSAAYGEPAGSVTVSGGGQTCTGKVTNGSGKCTITFPQAGQFTIIGTYGGNADYLMTSSAPLLVVVNP